MQEGAGVLLRHSITAAATAVFVAIERRHLMVFRPPTSPPIEFGSLWCGLSTHFACDMLCGLGRCGPFSLQNWYGKWLPSPQSMSCYSFADERALSVLYVHACSLSPQSWADVLSQFITTKVVDIHAKCQKNLSYFASRQAVKG